MVCTRKVWGVLGLLLALVVVVGYGQYGQQPQPPQPPQPQPPVGLQPTPAAMRQLQTQFMQQLTQLMNSAAQELKVPISPTGIFYATRSGDNPILAVAPARDLEKLTQADLERGAIVGLVYPGRREPIWNLPEGFYKVRCAILTPTATPGTPNAKAQFIDKFEKVVAEVPAIFEKASEGRPLGGPSAGGEIQECSWWPYCKCNVRICSRLGCFDIPCL
jgi:hypothetical protein